VFKTKLNNGCILILGAAKSGKSTLGLKMFDDPGRRYIFIATAEAGDTEMIERIKRHQEERGDKWITVEEPLDVVSRIKELDRSDTVILIDCLTLWLSNQFMKYGVGSNEIYDRIIELPECLSKTKGIVIAVSNEVGMGIVPENDLAREFRDAAGYMNQRIGAVANKVVVTFAGLPLILKDE
jgi:adenosylcobinamide kinase / adenosylcobinamide-phosphate guanylyltransferase